MTNEDLPGDTVEDLPADTSAGELPINTAADLPTNAVEDLPDAADGLPANAAEPSKGPPSDSVPENVARAALRSAITRREAADERRQHLEMAVQLARQLRGASERALLAFHDVDVTMVEHRAEEFKRLACGDSLSGLNLPDGLATRRAMRDVALEQVAAAKVTHEKLVADLSQAEDALRLAKLNVVIAASDVLMEEGAKQAAALNTLWNEMWYRFDRLSALSDCWLYYAEASFPITPPLEIVSLLQTIAALDKRQFANGRSDAAANAGEAWCQCFKLLLTDAEAEVTFERKSS
jgi:hypothetical protein